MAYQGEHFIARYGSAAAAHAPPIRHMLDMGIPVGAGTDATRVASYNPWVALYWLVAGKTVGGTSLYPAANRMSRDIDSAPCYNYCNFCIGQSDVARCPPG